MTRWFTADLHFGHANIIRYCDRPWRDVDAMDRGLVDRWNATVADDDDVWVLGDVAMGRIDDSLTLVHELAGTKLLVPGNHDRCSPGRGERAAEWAERYRDAGFAEILPEVVELTLAGPPGAGLPLPVLRRQPRRGPRRVPPPGRRRAPAAARPRPHAVARRGPPGERRLRRVGLPPGLRGGAGHHARRRQPAAGLTPQ